MLLGAAAVATIAVALSPSDVRHITVVAMLGGVGLVLFRTSRPIPEPDPELTFQLPDITPTSRPTTPKFVPPAALPPPGLLIGRDREMARLKSHLIGNRRPAIVVISGPAGIGKTALAVEAARSVSANFSGGTLFAEMPRDGSNDDILTSFVTALQPAGSPVPSSSVELLRLYRQLTANRAVLVVLDNVTEADAVRTLLPIGSRCAAIVTSRRSLPQLADAPEELLTGLARKDSLSVLERIVGASRIKENADAAESIAGVLGGLPLALQVTAATLAHRPNFPLQAAADRVTTPSVDDIDFARALDLSYALLPASEQTAVRVLGLLPKQTFSPWMLAALLDDPTSDLTPYEAYRQSQLDERDAAAWKICERLVHAQLLARISDDSSGVASFMVVDHVWEIAQRHPAVDDAEGLRRRARLHEATRVRNLLRPRDILRGNVYAALDQGDLNRALSHARGALARARELDTGAVAENADEHGLALAAVAEVLVEVGGFDDVNNLVAMVLRTGSRLARPRALRSLGKLQRRQRRLDTARETMLSARDAAREVHDGPEEIRVLRELGVIYASLDQSSRGLAVIDEALAFDPHDNRARVALEPSLYWAKGIIAAGGTGSGAIRDAETSLRRGAELAMSMRPAHELWAAWILYEQARLAVRAQKLPQAQVLALEAASRFMAMSHRYATARCRLLIGQAYLSQAKPTLALPFLEESVQTFASCGDRWSEGIASQDFARALGHVDRRADAARNLNRAIAIYSALGDRTNAQDVVNTVNELDVAHAIRWPGDDDVTFPAQVLLPTGDQDRR
jgi:tetratricopeptide (TPR) repeat protein